MSDTSPSEIARLEAEEIADAIAYASKDEETFRRWVITNHIRLKTQVSALERRVTVVSSSADEGVRIFHGIQGVGFLMRALVGLAVILTALGALVVWLTSLGKHA